MYKYTCRNCGFIQYGGIEISETRCNSCDSVKFGLKKKEEIDMSEKQSKVLMDHKTECE